MQLACEIYETHSSVYFASRSATRRIHANLVNFLSERDVFSYPTMYSTAIDDSFYFASLFISVIPFVMQSGIVIEI